jgi:murein DD-endopeptidase MepM/ murein hydrolase activator NlpD
MVSCFKGKFRVTSPRGTRTDPITGKKGTYHKGLDLVGIDDKTVYSICDGTVRTAYEANGAGYYIVVTMDDGRRVYYMHLKKGSYLVKNNERVVKGQALGIMGSTGASTGAHTHLELRVKGTSYDDLDIAEFTDIPNKIGVYEYKEQLTAKEKHEYAVSCACNLEDKTGLEKQTINWLWTYKYADDLFIKLWDAMK